MRQRAVEVVLRQHERLETPQLVDVRGDRAGHEIVPKIDVAQLVQAC